MAKTAMEDHKLKDWQSKLESAKTLYSDDRNRMTEFQKYYKGDREVRQDPNNVKMPTKVASNVRNIVYELIESEVDTSIPMPRVRAIHAEDDELAKKIERLLENKIHNCGLPRLNDLMERTTYVQGGDFFHVQWDQNAGTHTQIGDIRITEVHPKKLIPQPGVADLENMDYFFIQELMTKKSVQRAYDKDVSETENDQPEMKDGIDDANLNPDLVTVNTAYYRNDEGGIGVYVWCDNVVLRDLEDYQARYLDRCEKCGAVMQNGICPICGSKKAKKSKEDYEDLVDAVEIKVDGAASPATLNPFEQEPVLDEMGNPVIDEMGIPQIRQTKKKIPYYKPDVFPVITRRNVSEQDRLLGSSDVAIIIDQQDTIKKLGSKINEKLLKGGSFVTLPKGKDVEKTDKEFKIIRIENPAEKQLIDVINVQPNVQFDESYLEINYQWAKSALGITDSFQGKYDASALSGSAKQYSINQAAGRLESKRVQKNEAFAKLYEIMFKYWLAYSDQDTELSSVGVDGQPVHDSISRMEFLKMDRAGELYWDDEFLFETDPTSTLMQNREMLWNQTDMKLQSGAFGQVGDLETARAYWTIMKANGYPNAGKILELVEGRIEEQKQMAQQMQAAQMPPMPEGAPGEMPVM